MKKTSYESRLPAIVLAICIGTVVALGFSVYAEKTEDDISSAVIRLHVIANSDKTPDQQLKLKVRDEVLALTEEWFSSADDISAVCSVITEKLPLIKSRSEETVNSMGFDYPVRVSLGDSVFPTKVYGNVTLPAGTYRALKIELGEAAGQNWWCVMFPPLCFVDATTAQIPADSMIALKKNLTADEYSLLTETDMPGIEVRFKLYEMWQNGKIKLKSIVTALRDNKSTDSDCS